jgi:hypothetical protein
MHPKGLARWAPITVVVVEPGSGERTEFEIGHELTSAGA